MENAFHQTKLTLGLVCSSFLEPLVHLDAFGPWVAHGKHLVIYLCER